MKIALLGYGKMGREIEKIALERKHQVVLKISRKNLDELTAQNLAKADVAIEFSTPETARDNIYKCFNANIPVVVGTTGWLQQLPEIKSACTDQNQALLYSSNFSVGVNLFFELNKRLAQLMNNHATYDVIIKEIHHVHKKDAPSGTAISIANDIINNLERKSRWINQTSANTADLSIHSVREDNVPGTHSVKYSSAIDDIEIIHTAHNRTGFALGAVIAAEWLVGKKGVFGMTDVLSVRN